METVMSELLNADKVTEIKLDVNRDHDDYYFPLNLALAKNLLGNFLTHVDALGLPPEQGKAVKDLVRKSFWSWWETVQENSMTSYRGCIAPIEVLRDRVDDSARKYRWMTPAIDAVVSVNV